MPPGLAHDLVGPKDCMPRPSPIYASDVMGFASGSSATRTRETPRRRTRVLFVVSRDRPDRHESLVHAFSSDADVKVIFDRRRADRRSDVRTGALRSMGWVRVDC